MTQTATLTESLTYAQLVAKIQASALKKGASYTITDFQTVHYILEDNDVFLDGENNPEINTGEIEPITVLALTNNTISNIASSSLYPEDIIYYDWNPDNWIYDVAFAGYDEVILTGWKGVIWQRENVKNNILLPGDWRHCKYRRWAVNNPPEGVQNAYIAIKRNTSGFGGVVSVNDYIDTLFFEETEADPISDRIMNVRIYSFRDRHIIYYVAPTILINTVIQVTPNLGWYQVFNLYGTGLFYGNTISGDLMNNNIGHNFCYNSISKSFTDNNILGSFSNNILVSVDYNVFDGFNQYLNLNAVRFCRFGVGVGYIVVPYFAPSTWTRYVNFKSGVKGIVNNLLDFTGSTHITGDYNCEIFKRLDGTIRLKYVDNTDADIVVAYNA